LSFENERFFSLKRKARKSFRKTR